MNMKIFSPTTYETTHYEAIRSLLEQLTTRDIEFGPETYLQLIASPYSRLFLLLHEGSVAGMFTVGTYLSPTGSKAWIEDVVVDKNLRGYGLGRAMIAHAIDYCKDEGISTIYLTSNPKRTVANRLYQSMGFVRKETNMYKLDLKR